jgi:H+-transporting ATPase
MSGKTNTGDEERSQMDYPEVPYYDVLKMLKSDATTGLSNEEAQSRLSRYGPNEVVERKINPAIRLAKKFWGLTAWMLELAIIFSFLLHRYFDVYVIASLLVVNAIVAFIQEQKASSAMEMLRKQLQIGSRVLRDGRWQTISAKELVPGDIVRVRTGDYVPTDLKMIEKAELGADQSALTGESIIVEKKQDDILFAPFK